LADLAGSLICHHVKKNSEIEKITSLIKLAVSAFIIFARPGRSKGCIQLQPHDSRASPGDLPTSDDDFLDVVHVRDLQ
jgi:hypothetical protein